MSRRGICAAGTMNVDIVHQVESYPNLGELTTITGAREVTVGGLACNVALSLSMLDPSLPIQVCGVLGDDPEGAIVRAHFQQHANINLDGIRQGLHTAYTLVINDYITKERTLFVSCGSGDTFDVGDVDLDRISARIFHAGYVLLLKALDREDREYGTRMARLLAAAKERGMLTSIDVVSEVGERFQSIVPPALKHVDYCIINELEAQQISGVPLRRKQDGLLHPENMPEALRSMKRFGVSRWTVIHSPEGAFGLDEHDAYVHSPSLTLPEGYIISTTGAGDAFCAGTLYGAHEGWPLADALRLGTAAAACSIAGKDSYSRIRPVSELLSFYRQMGGA